MARKASPSPILLRLAGTVGASWVRMSHRVIRWDVIGESTLAEYREKPAIWAAWHGRMYGLVHMNISRKARPMALASTHKDAEFAVALMGPLRIEPVRGSSSNVGKPDKNKRGSDALRELYKGARAGKSILITPDGPRGPARNAQLGAIQLSRLVGMPIIPLSFNVKRAWRFAGWDSFVAPRPDPFNKGVLSVGEPIFVTGSGDEAAQDALKRLELGLNQATALADEACGLNSNPAGASSSLAPGSS